MHPNNSADVPAYRRAMTRGRSRGHSIILRVLWDTQHYIAPLLTSGRLTQQLIIDVNDQRYLKPANRRYPLVPVTQEMTIVGVVVMKMRVY